MSVIDNFLIRNNTVYINTRDETQWPIAQVSNHIWRLPRWVSMEPSEFEPYTPTVIDIIDAIKILSIQDFVHHRGIIKELEDYLCL